MNGANAASLSSPYGTYLSYLKDGKLAYQYSEASARAVFYPRVLCPDTGEENLQWRVSAGLGTVYSTSTVHPARGDAYNVALIDCDEGFRLMSRVENMPPDDVAIGMRVRVSIHWPPDDDPYPIFTPLETP